MRFLLRGFLAVPLLILFSCSAPVDIEGDVFLVKGDGKPQPSAAKEVIFIKAESFESILIESYLGSVQEEAQKNAAIYLELCATSSAVQIPPAAITGISSSTHSRTNCTVVGCSDKSIDKKWPRWPPASIP